MLGKRLSCFLWPSWLLLNFYPNYLFSLLYFELDPLFLWKALPWLLRMEESLCLEEELLFLRAKGWFSLLLE